MSKQIDERVVSMQFDNRNFEKNVSTTLSTLDKLKQKLNFTGSAKGLENISTATKNVDMNGLAKGVETVRAKFSALEVMGVTALANITNSAVNAGKRMVKALTIEPIMDGFREYEMMMNTIQTTMAATGKTAKEVEDELKRLDEYADKTVYSTADMMNNLPKFTNAGVELEKATTAMIGIANATALAGGDASKASIAFYNLGQAIGTGYLTRMDYNSINNAGIATMEWKNQMVQAAIEAKTLKKVGDDLYEAGGKQFTLQQLFIDGLQKQWATTDVMMKVFQDYGDETTEIGKKAYASAQDIKTFTQMMESLKATAGTGWKDTWQLIFGDLDEAKALWTGLTNFLSGIITKMTKFRNGILESALGKSFTNLIDKVNGVTKPLNKAVDAIKDYKKVVNEIIRGDWGNGQSRWDKLTQAGYDWAHAQNLVNEKLGVSLRRTTKYTEEQNKNAKATTELTDKEATRIAQLARMSDAELKALGYTKEQIQAFRDLAEAADKIGLPLEEFIQKIDEIDGRWLLVNTFKNIGDAISQTATVIGEAWKSIFPNTSDNIANGLFDLIAGFHKLSTSLGGFVDESGKLTESGENLKRTLEGVFAALDIVLTLTSGPLGIAFKIFKGILEAIDIPILEFTAIVGDGIVKVRDWIDSIFDFSGWFEKIAPYIEKAADAVRKFIDAFKNSEFVEVGKNLIAGLANGIKDGASTVWDAVVALAKSLLEKICSVLGIHSPSTETYAIGENVVQGLANGIQNGAGTLWAVLTNFCSGIIETFKNFDWGQIADFLWIVASFFPSSKIVPIIRAFANFAANCGETLIESFKNVLGIHSPSTKFFELGKNVIEGLVNGLKDGASTVWNTIKDIGKNMAAFFKKIDFGAIFAGGLAIGALVILKKLIDVADKFADLGGIGGFLGDLGEGLKKNLKAEALEKKTNAILNIAKAIAVLAGALAILTYLAVKNPGAMKQAIASIVILAGVVAALAFAADKLTTSTMSLDKSGGLKRTASAAGALMAVATSLLIVAAAVKILSTIDVDSLPTVMTALGQIVIAMLAIMATMGALDSMNLSGSVGGAGSMMLKMAAGLLILVLAIKMIAKLDDAALGRGIAVVAMIELLFLAVIAVSKLAGQHANKAGAMLLLMSLAFLIMVRVIKAASKLEGEAVIKAIGVIGLVGGLFIAMTAVSQLAGKNASKAGIMLLLMSGAFLIMTSVIRQISDLDENAIKKGLVVITGVGIIFAALIAVSHFAGANAAKAGMMLLTMSGALLILTGAMFILAHMDSDGLWRSLAVVAVLEALFGGLIAVSHLAKDCKGSLVVLTVVITLLIAALVGLTFIEPKKLYSSVGAIVAVLASFALLMASTSKLGDAKKMIGPLAMMLVVIAALSFIIYKLADLDVESSLETVGSLSILLIAMAASMALLGTIKSTGMGKAVLAMAGMGLVVAELAVILGLISKYDMHGSLSDVGVLSAMLLAMTGVLAILSLIGLKAMYATEGVKALALIGLIVGELAIILGLMSHFDVNPSIETAASLSILLLAMSGVVAILSLIGVKAVFATAGIEAMGILLAAIAGVLIVCASLTKLWPGLESFLDTGIPILEKIGYALGSFIGNIVGGFLGGATSGLPEIGTKLSDFMKNIQPFIDGIKGMDESAVNGAKSLAGAILALTATDWINTVISHISTGASFSSLGKDLSKFMENISPFIEGAKSLTSDSMTGAKNLAETILILTAANVLDGLTLWGSNSDSLSKFGDQLVPFGKAMAAFSAEVAGKIDEGAVTAAANAGKVMAEMQSKLYGTDGVIQWFCGEKDMATFGTQLTAFGKAIVGFSQTVSAEGAINEKAVTAAANAGSIMAEMQSKLYGTDGVIQWFCGEKDMATFGVQLVAFGNAIVGFSKTVSAEGAINENAIKAAANAGTLMATLQSSLEPINGVVQAFTGKKDLSTFGANIKAYGDAIVAFSSTVSAEGAINETAVTAAANAGKILTNVQKAIPEDKWFDGKMSLDDFGKKIKKFGEGIKGYSEEVTGIDTGAVSSSVSAAKNMVIVAKGAAGIDGDSVEKFKKVKTIGDTMSDYSSKVGDINSGSINTSISAAKKLVSLINGMAGMDTSGVGSFKDAITSLSSVSFEGVVKAFSDSAAKLATAGSSMIDSIIKGMMSRQSSLNLAAMNIVVSMVKPITSKVSDFNNLGKKLIDNLSKGITSKSASVKLASIKTLGSAVEGIRGYYNKFYNAGSYLVSGFASGISANSYKAAAKATAMANAAEEAARKALDINSPSKVFRRIGMSIPEGFAMGIEKLGYAVTASSTDMANLAVSGVKDSISRITDLINSDIDSQPTIRPVVDLSDVTSSASLISGMFDMNPSIGVMTNARAINTMMNRNQNGTNNDIVSAINDLKSATKKSSGNTYVVNGVTYDDGSNVSSVVADLIRAAKVERRT